MRGDVLACWDDSLISKLIRKITNQKSSHVAIMYNENLAMESWWYGVRFATLEEVKKRSNFHVLRYKYPEKVDYDKVVDFMERNLHIKYDFIQLITVGLHKIFGSPISNSNNRYICSEFIWLAYKSGGVEIVPQIPDSVDDTKPGDLLESPVIEKIDTHIKGESL